MKVRVTMKSPDALSDAIYDAVERKRMIAVNDGTTDDFDAEYEREELYEELSKWFKYGEYLTVEIDTDTGVAEVVAP